MTQNIDRLDTLSQYIDVDTLGRVFADLQMALIANTKAYTRACRASEILACQVLEGEVTLAEIAGVIDALREAIDFELLDDERHELRLAFATRLQEKKHRRDVDCPVSATYDRLRHERAIFAAQIASDDIPF